MREFAKVSPHIWISERGKEIKRLGIESQFIAFYLSTNPHAVMIGIYYLPIAFIAHETGLSTETVVESIRKLENINYCTYDESSEYIWVHDMGFEQIGMQMKPSDNRVKAVNDAYLSLPNLPFLHLFFDKYAEAFLLENCRDIAGALKGLGSKEKKKENEKEQEKEISLSGKPDVDPLKTSFFNKNKEQQASLKAQAIEVLHFLNEKTGRAYRPVEPNLKLIMARIDSGATVMDCRQIIAKKTREWKGDAKMNEFLRPATLFNASKFEQYIGELCVPEEESNGD